MASNIRSNTASRSCMAAAVRASRRSGAAIPAAMTPSAIPAARGCEESAKKTGGMHTTMIKIARNQKELALKLADGR